MLPLAPIRTLFLGLLSCIILGAGIYASYVALKPYEPVTAGTYPIDRAASDTVSSDADSTDIDSLNRDPARAITISEADARLANEQRTRQRWTAGTIAVLCLLWSLAGRLPVQAIFRISNKASSKAPSPHSTPGKTLTVQRPCGSLLHVEVHGKETGPTLVLTHGWSLDSAAWKYMLPFLAAHYRVAIWDLPGLGRSRGPQNNDYSLEKMAEDLGAVISEVSPHDPVILIGHSIGGMIQQTFCRLYPERLRSHISGLVLVHTTYTNPLKTNIAAGLVKPLEPVVKLINDAMIPLEAMFWLSNWQSYWNGTLHVAARFESFSGKQSWDQLDYSAKRGALARPSVIARGNDAMLEFDEQETLRRIDCPTLVVSGNNDRLTVRSASEHIQHLLPQSDGFDDDGGHLGHIESTSAVAQEIVRFAGRVIPAVPV